MVLMADRLSLGQIESLAKKVSEREADVNESILGQGLSALVAITWLSTHSDTVEKSVSGGVVWSQQRQAMELGYLADVHPITSIQFTGGSAFHEFQELEDIELQNREELSPIEERLIESYTE